MKFTVFVAAISCLTIKANAIELDKLDLVTNDETLDQLAQMKATNLLKLDQEDNDRYSLDQDLDQDKAYLDSEEDQGDTGLSQSSSKSNTGNGGI